MYYVTTRYFGIAASILILVGVTGIAACQRVPEQGEAPAVVDTKPKIDESERFLAWNEQEGISIVRDKKTKCEYLWTGGGITLLQGTCNSDVKLTPSK